MIVYRAEIWCDGQCQEGSGKGIPHDDHLSLPSLARNLTAIRVKEGWTTDWTKHWCPTCSEKREREVRGKR